MCTCINFKTKDNYFGRNLDLEYNFGQKVVVTPKNYEFKLKNKQSFKTKYAMIGMASVAGDYPLYAEAANEKGLAVAGLYFPDNAYYNEEKKEKINITPFELIPWILGNFKSIDELKKVIYDLNITNLAFSKEMPLVKLHWMISDSKECIVLEQMNSGLKIYQNHLGILTNNPPFDYHLLNINNYMNLTPKLLESRFSKELSLKPYGQGMGTIGLPGDNSPASRFIRATFNKFNSVCEDNEESSVTQVFHVLDSVKMVKGTVITDSDKYDITIYSCCINTDKGIYYYKTYENNQITAIKMDEENKNSTKLSVYNIIKNQQIKYIN